MAVTIDEFTEKTEKNLIVIAATIHTERDSHKGILIGKRGAMMPVPATTVSPAGPAKPAPAAPTPAVAGQPAPPQGPPPADVPPVPPQPIQSFSYRSVGTVITCRAAGGEGGQYDLTLSVDDTAVLPRDAGQASGAPGIPVFRSFRARNTLVLRDGQTRSFTAAADRVSGEVVRVEVTLRALKN